MKNYDYGMIGNCTSAALIGADTSIDWLCLPFFDSPSLFAKILDEDKGGFFRIKAVDPVSIRQNYVYHTAIIKTVIETKTGAFEIYDFMPRFNDSSGEVYCPSEIHRDIRVIAGRPQIIIELVPKPNYASGEAYVAIGKEYIKITSTKGTYNSFYLYSNLDHEKIIKSEPIELKESSFFLLSYHEKLEPINLYKVYVEYERTKSYWLAWSLRSVLPAKYKDMLVRSAITLKMLTFQRTGAVIAAPTTSLPEIIGQGRNWDYRYCWVRDASMIIDLYARIGHLHLAQRFLSFIINRMLLKHEDIAVMYGINGERELPEKVLEHLSGYEGSRPVRIGNDAYRQKQNDLYGELVETIYTYFWANMSDRVYLDEEMWTLVRSLVNEVRRKWREPDCGIWEQRTTMRHYVHSKLMSWVAMDRAAKIAGHIGKSDYAAHCLKTAAEIREDILKNGYDEQLKSFTMAYGSQELDASNLLMLHYGFLKSDDPRMRNTVKATYERLVKDGFTLRYTGDDGLGKQENAFIVCTFWMINALYLTGEEEKARRMFDNVLQCANPLGLFSEDIEIPTRRLTGNFPQGYSHLAFIQTVFLLETAYNWDDVTKIEVKSKGMHE